MTQTRPILSNQRRARLETWAGLWLLRWAACLARFAPALLPPLAPVKRLLLDLLMLHVGEMVVFPPPRRRHRPGAPIRASLRRAFLGDVRKCLRARTPGESVGKLLALVRDMNVHALRIAVRLARGLTRLRPILTAPMRAEALADGAAGGASLAAPRADSS